jgi:hypothetical protein
LANPVDNANYIAIAGVIATALGALVTWLVMRRQFASKKLSYFYRIEPIIRSDDEDLARDLKVYYRGEELPSPTLLTVDIANIGLSAIENAKVVISLPDATYLIPGYFVDVPTGYYMLWNVKRTDAEECTVELEHINPKQVARLRLLMDGVPNGEPRISCAMPNVTCTRANAKISMFAQVVVEMVAPQARGILGPLNQAGITAGSEAIRSLIQRGRK